MAEVVLVTGDRGYIGSVLIEALQEHGYRVCGLDAGYYEPVTDGLQTLDVRDGAPGFLGIDSIVHLASLSNDPLGEFDPSLTESINLHATVRLAKLAKQAGVKRFVFASSQSLYGVSETDEELTEDAPKNPVTAYARTKWEAEQALNELADETFTVVSFRPATVFGWSPRFRADIVFNSFVGSAFTTKSIVVRSDGSPWRPVIHVRDVCQAFVAGLKAPADVINGKAYNVGVRNGNYQVRDLAEAARKAYPWAGVVYTGEHADSRTYRVSFDRIFDELGEWYKPTWTLSQGAMEMIGQFRKTGFTEGDFKGRKTNRLAQLEYLINRNILDRDLRWI